MAAEALATVVSVQEPEVLFCGKVKGPPIPRPAMGALVPPEPVEPIVPAEPVVLPVPLDPAVPVELLPPEAQARNGRQRPATR